MSVLLAILIYKTTYIPRNIIYFCLILALIPFIESFIINIKNKRQLCSKEKKSRNLGWDFPYKNNSNIWIKITGFIYFVFLFIPWLFFKNHFKGNIVFFILLVTLLYSQFTNKNNKINIFQQWESKWCFLAVIILIIFLLIKIPFVKKLYSQI